MFTDTPAPARTPYAARVMDWSDERRAGDGIIVTLAHGWAFEPSTDANAACHVRGFDTVTAAKAGISKEAQPCPCGRCNPPAEAEPVETAPATFPSPYAVTDPARFSFDAYKVFPGTFGQRDPLRYVADAFRHCERTQYGVAEFIAEARAKWCDPARPAYWDCVERALAFFEAHPNAGQVVHAFRRNAPRAFTEQMLERFNYLAALEEAFVCRKLGADHDARRALESARHMRLTYRTAR
jgi:hypothetical protein